MLRPALASSVSVVSLCVFGSAFVWAAAPGDWPQWRGPERDGLSQEKGLAQSWPEEGPQLLWKTTGLGKGFATVAIAGTRIYTLGIRKGEQYLLALELDGGKEVWATKVGGGDREGARSTPTVDGVLVYALGSQGDLLCAKTGDGSEVWRKNFGKDFGGKMMSGWGYCESPLVDGKRLLCTPGGKDAAVVALDKATGETIWKAPYPDLGSSGKDGAGYSSIVLSKAAGVKQYVQLLGRGIASFGDDGKYLWGYNRVANGTANIPTPIATGDYVFCSSGYGTGSALLKIEKAGSALKAEEVYFKTGKELQNHHGGMVLVGDYLYCGHGHNGGLPVCVELKTGKFQWGPERGAGGNSAAVTYADGCLYFRYESGVMALVAAKPDGYELKGQFKIPGARDPSWPHPVVAGGKLYLREQDQLLCYDIKQK